MLMTTVIGWRNRWNEELTNTMHPQKRARIHLPGYELLTPKKPRTGARLFLSTSRVVIRRRIWGVEPVANPFLTFICTHCTSVCTPRSNNRVAAYLPDSIVA